MTEYTILVKTTELNSAIARATPDEVTEHLTPPLTEVGKELSQICETLLGGGWEIVSHDIARLNHHLLIAFLLRR